MAPKTIYIVAIVLAVVAVAGAAVFIADFDTSALLPFQKMGFVRI